MAKRKALSRTQADDDWDRLMAELDEQASEMEDAMDRRLLAAALKEKRPYRPRRKLRIIKS